MIPLENVRQEEGVRGQESGVRGEEQTQLSRSERRQYPPGVDNRGLEFNAQAVFSPDERVEMWIQQAALGCGFGDRAAAVARG